MKYTDFEIEERVTGEWIIVTAIIHHNGHKQHGAPPLPPGWVMMAGPTVYVSEPNVFERMLGRTLEAKLARARQHVSVWAQREIARHNRLADALEQSLL